MLRACRNTAPCLAMQTHQPYLVVYYRARSYIFAVADVLFRQLFLGRRFPRKSHPYVHMYVCPYVHMSYVGLQLTTPLGLDYGIPATIQGKWAN